MQTICKLLPLTVKSQLAESEPRLFSNVSLYTAPSSFSAFLTVSVQCLCDIYKIESNIIIISLESIQ